MGDSQAACSFANDFNPFLAGSLAAERRKVFMAHLDGCPSCPATLESLREDERLAATPLTPEERKQIRSVVEAARRRYGESLETDWVAREALGERQQQALSEGLKLQIWQKSPSWRALFFTVLFALLLAALWWYART